MEPPYVPVMPLVGIYRKELKSAYPSDIVYSCLQQCNAQCSSQQLAITTDEFKKGKLKINKYDIYTQWSFFQL